MIATSSPEIKRVRERTLETTRKKTITARQKNRETVHGETVSHNDHLELESDVTRLDLSSETCLDSSDETETEVPLQLNGVDGTLSVGEFIICEFSSKGNGSYYAAEVVEDLCDQVKVNFLRKNPKVDNWFVRPDEDDIADVPRSYIKTRLQRIPANMHTTARTKKVISFQESLQRLNIN